MNIRHESLKAGYAAVLTVRVVAFLILVAGMLSLVVTLLSESGAAWFLRRAAVEKATSIELSALDTIDKSAAESLRKINEEESAGLERLRQEEQKTGNDLEVLAESYSEVARALNAKGPDMMAEIGRTGACRVTDFHKLEELYEQGKSWENFQATCQSINANKESLSAWVTQHIRDAHAAVQKKRDDARRELEEAQSELDKLLAEHEPEERTREVDVIITRKTLDKNLYGEDGLRHVQCLRGVLTSISCGQALPAKLELPEASPLKANSISMGKWLLPVPSPEWGKASETYMEEHPWSDEERKRRAELEQKIPQLNALTASYKSQLQQLEQLEKNVDALVRGHWEIDTCVKALDALFARARELEAQRNAIPGRMEELRKQAVEQRAKNERAQQSAALAARYAGVQARNAARSTFSIAQVACLLSPLMLLWLPITWLAWALLLVLADYMACPLQSALRLQSIDERQNKTEK